MRLPNALISVALLILLLVGAPRAVAAAVEVREATESYTLSNGILAAEISKHSGGLISLKYDGLETLDAHARGTPGYWSHSPASGKVTDAITIDPKSNGGQRGEVSIKGISGGAQMGSGPGGSVVADIEIRYALGRDDSALYTYSIFDHPSQYPATSVGEARFCAKLNDSVFDWMTIDLDRNMKMITAYDWDHGTVMNMKEARRMNTGLYTGQVEHKYDYSAVQFDTLAWGWSSTSKHVGLWFINPTIEYLSGGATKVELSAHRDATFGNDPNAPAPPCLLNYWRGSHYGGSSCVVAAGEHWNKVIGPFLIYCNAGSNPEAMYHDALSRSELETKAWPYGWVNGIDYPHREQRAVVNGQIVLNDPGAPGARMTHLLVGLAAPDYRVPVRDGSALVDWQLDAKHYEFWTRGDEQGHFTIPAVRPGKYTLHAIATGVLGELTRTDVQIDAGKTVDLGRLEWKPVRFGKQLWDVGIPDRTAAEFLHGNHYWQWGLYNEYPKDFPNDVHFVIGQSDFHKDWNYCQCPRADRPNGTTWSIEFDLPEARNGKATLRLAFAATSARSVTVTVNDEPAGQVTRLIDTATIRRDGIRGYWYERDVTFDAALLKQGRNVLKLTIPPGNPMSGIEYDYVRLELN